MKLLELIDIADKEKVVDFWHGRRLARLASSKKKKQKPPPREDSMAWYLGFLEEIKAVEPLDLKSEQNPAGTFFVEVYRITRDACQNGCADCDDSACFRTSGRYTFEDRSKLIPANIDAFEADEWYSDYPQDTEFCEWGEWLSYEILDQPIKAYGAERVLDAILWDMTFCGFTYKETLNGLREWGFDVSGDTYDENGFLIIDGILWGYKGAGGYVTVPKSVTKISKRAFSDEAYDELSKKPDSFFLTGLTIHAGIVDIDICGLGNGTCCHLEKIEVEDGNERYAAVGNCLIEKATNTVIVGCNYSVIPAGIEKIGWCAFCGCEGLKKILIPESVIEIEFSAFSCCHSLKSIIIPESVIKIGSGAFADCNNLTVYARVDKKPKGWNRTFAKSQRKVSAPVIWGFKGNKAEE